ncbi:hypothetical protein [Ornithinibacillus halotolerans]|uniref:Uncharacterized protein n=1 Tax=Ornithinibacillus halotolerans TaxID=1274357 RepID=A0A916W334_9BACI|nr:hypothetical protein [Ornithinibacillus halotolerans]GGA62027.1 hypothetical protein GCM10008025_02450 [Ornithinibacillus halotolerans]
MRKSLLVLILFCICLVILPIVVTAEEQLEVHITYGIDGKVKKGKGFPVTVKVQNNGESVSGDLVFYSSPSYDSVGNVVVPVEFPKGEETTVAVSIPGLNDYYFGSQGTTQTYVRFYEGSWEEGKEVTLKGNTKTRPSFLPEQRIVIGALTNDPDSLNALKTLRYKGESVEFFHITKDNVANDAMGLGLFDVIVLNNYQIASLSDEQIDAIYNWTTSGGHLMIGSDPFLQQHNRLKDMLLMEIKEQASFSDLNFLKLSEDEELPNFENLEIHSGDIVDDVHVIYSDHSLPMVLNKTFGLGEVTQFAFNLSSESITKWENYSNWLSQVFQQTVDVNYYGHNNYMRDDLTYRFQNVAQMYPSLFIPVQPLVILFIIYLIVLIPALYFLLKKLDKREIAWIIIPAVAVLSSIAIFIVGAKDRIGGSQINHVNLIAIDENGKGNGFGAFSVLTSSGGDYPLTIKSNSFDAFPINQYSSYESESMRQLPMVEKGRQQTLITYQDVEYWSIRSALGPIKSLETGELDTDLWVENNQLIGSVTSNLSFDLEDAYLLSGSKAYELGPIQAGETISVDIKLDSNNVQDIIGAPRSNLANKVIPGYYNQGYGGMSEPKGKNSIEEWKKYELLDSSLYFDLQPTDKKQPIIAGFTKDKLVDITLDKSLKKYNSLSVVTQGVHVDIRSLQGGEFKLSRDEMRPELSILSNNQGFIHHNGLMYDDNFASVDQGEYQLVYQLPVEMNLDHITITKLRVTHPISADTEFSIYQPETGEFVLLDGSQTTLEEDVSSYISEEGKIIITFVKTGMTNPDVTIPMLEVEGVYNQ